VCARVCVPQKVLCPRKARHERPKRSLQILSCKPSDPAKRRSSNQSLPELSLVQIGEAGGKAEAAERARLKKPVSTQDMQLLQVIVPKTQRFEGKQAYE
jgi:hypothetical protein